MNRGQSDAMGHSEGPCVVIAPPGSGKTFVLTGRICELVKKHGILPEKILVITFTRAAAEQMRKRYREMSVEADNQVTFGTFHSVFFRILRQSLQMGAVLGGGCVDHIQILSEQEKNRILTAIVNSIKTERDELPDTEQMREFISKKKNRIEAEKETASVTETQGSVMESVFRSYCAECARRGCLDYEDIIIACKEMLESKRNERILRFWQERFPYILIDEFQDISPMQFSVIRMLAEPRQNLFVVGDDDQAIYGFRGSDSKLMLELSRFYPDIRTLFLTVNYRSGERIIRTADRLICHNQLRYPKTISAAQTEGGAVRVVVCTDPEQQSQCLLERFAEKPQGESLAVIVRTNAQAAAVRRMIERAGMRYAKTDRAKAPECHPAARDVLAYFCLAGIGADTAANPAGIGTDAATNLASISADAVSGQEERLEAMLLIANKPDRAIAREAIVQCAGDLNQLLAFYEGNALMQGVVTRFKKQLTVLAQMPPHAAVRYVQKGIGYEEYILRQSGRSRAAQEEALQILSDLHQEAHRFTDIRDWMNAIQGKGQAQEDLAMQEGAVMREGAATQGGAAMQEDRGAIHVLTMHACKGLEYDHVVIPDVCEGLMPYKRAFLPEDIEEERRLLYVAMTRARKTLLMTCIHKQGDPKMQMSRFMKEILNRRHSSSSESSSSSKASSSRYSS